MPRGSRLGRCCFLSTKIRFLQPTKICLLQKHANENVNLSEQETWNTTKKKYIEQ